MDDPIIKLGKTQRVSVFFTLSTFSIVCATLVSIWNIGLIYFGIGYLQQIDFTFLPFGVISLLFAIFYWFVFGVLFFWGFVITPFFRRSEFNNLYFYVFSAFGKYTYVIKFVSKIEDVSEEIQVKSREWKGVSTHGYSYSREALKITCSNQTEVILSFEAYGEEYLRKLVGHILKIQEMRKNKVVVSGNTVKRLIRENRKTIKSNEMELIS
jgi:hypothetical protein